MLLDDTNAVGNVESVLLLGEADESLLDTVGTDEGVDLGSLDVVQTKYSVGDLLLCGLDVAEEDEGIVVLDLLHGSLSGQGRNDDTELIHLVASGIRLDRVLGLLFKLSSLGSEEVNVPSDLPDNSRRSLLQSLSNSLCLLDLGFGSLSHLLSDDKLKFSAEIDKCLCPLSVSALIRNSKKDC